jgi:hypothetical protein
MGSVCAPSIMLLGRAVLQISAKSAVPPRLPFHKIRPLLTHSKSILLQVLIPLHFNSPRINTYKKPGGRGGVYPSHAKVLQLVTTHTSRNWTHSNASNPNHLMHFRALSVTKGCTCIGAYRPPFVRSAHFVRDLSAFDSQPPSATMPSAFRSHLCTRP